MKKSLIFVFALAFLLVLSVGVYAINENAGNGSGALKIKEQLREKYMNKTCDNLGNLSERVTCRVVNRVREKNEVGVLEACKNLEPGKRGRCVALYNAFKNCHEKNGADRDRCLKKAVGLRNANISRIENATEMRERTREYLVGLLDNLEDKVLRASDNGRIDEMNASQLIIKITETKESVFSGQNKAEVKQKVADLKRMINEVKAKLDEQ